MSDHSDVIVHHSDTGFDREEPRSFSIFILTAVSIVTLLIVVGAMHWYFNRVEEEKTYREVLVPISELLTNLHQREDQALKSYQVIDKTKNTVHLPIDRAMQLVIEESASGKLPFPQKPTPVKAPDAPTAAAPAPAAPPVGAK